MMSMLCPNFLRRAETISLGSGMGTRHSSVSFGGPPPMVVAVGGCCAGAVVGEGQRRNEVIGEVTGAGGIADEKIFDFRARDLPEEGHC